MFDKTLGTKRATFADSTKAEIPLRLGIYKGIIKKVDRETRNGRLYVYIDGPGSADPDNPSGWSAVTYASPYGGTTTGPQTVNTVNDFANTKQTYGMFMSPPDVGSTVLCCFPNGENEGYWFACINHNLSKYMVPAIGAVDRSKINEASIPANLKDILQPGNFYPVGEFNENETSPFSKSDWVNWPKPLHIPQTLNLIRQGLDSDRVRGAISSSIQRDPISSVLGFSTPGRPISKQDPANVKNLADILKTGSFNSSQFDVTTRVGGHTLVMDDGDIFGTDNLLRLKTSAGHQLLMNDTEGIVYISNASGNAWVELTKDGDVLIYGKRDLAINTEGNIMMHSAKNISFNAQKNIDMHAGAAIRMESPVIQTNAGQTLTLYGKKTQIKAASSVTMNAGSTMSLKATGSLGVTGSAILLNSGAIGASIPTPQKLKQYSLPNAQKNSVVWQIQPNAISSINYKIPTHEPYIRQTTDTATQTTVVDEGTSVDIDGNVIRPPKIYSAPGPSRAMSAAVKRPAPTSSFINQTDTGRSLGNLNKDQYRAYLAQLGYTESGGNYIPTNSNSSVPGTNQFGYVGKYQLGAAALADLGLVKSGTVQNVDAINNPNNWIGGTGKPANLQEFLANPDYQEQAMYNYTKDNYSALQKYGLITAETSAEETAGLLSAAHIGGAGGTNKWFKGGLDASDANGTSISQYYNQGRYSQTQVSTIIASNASKPGLI